MNWYRILSYTAVPIWVWLAVRGFQGQAIFEPWQLGVICLVIALNNLSDGIRGRRAK